MKFREHRGGLAESMATCVEVADRAALIAVIEQRLAPFGRPFTRAQIDAGLDVEPYGCSGMPLLDLRIGWYTYIVTLDGYGVLGFTDGPCPQV